MVPEAPAWDKEDPLSAPLSAPNAGDCDPNAGEDWRLDALLPFFAEGPEDPPALGLPAAAGAATAGAAADEAALPFPAAADAKLMPDIPAGDFLLRGSMLSRRLAGGVGNEDGWDECRLAVEASSGGLNDVANFVEIFHQSIIRGSLSDTRL